MPFPIPTLKVVPKTEYNGYQKQNKRKEYRFADCSGKLSCIVEKASVSASQSCSITVEAAFCVPLFVYAAVCLIWMLELRAIQNAVRCGLEEAGKELAEQVYELPFLVPSQVESGTVASIGAERLDRSLVEGGSSGLDCSASYMIPGSGVMELKVRYRARLPFPVFAVPPLEYRESMRMKGWNGYVRQGFSEPEDRTIVYITETGVVYHRDYHCTYLEPSIRMVDAKSLEGLRNDSQGRYYACERCMRGHAASGMVYITDYGDRYHSTLGCSGLKRTIYAVPISEVKGKGACSKCGR